MQITYEIIDKDTANRIITETIDIKTLKTELVDIEKQIEDAEKEPDEITVPNESKLHNLGNLKYRQEEINELLTLING